MIDPAEKEQYTCPICHKEILVKNAESVTCIPIRKIVGSNFLYIDQWYHTECLLNEETSKKK